MERQQEREGDVNLLRFDATSDRLGIGIAAPTEKLEVVGNVLISGTKTLKIIDRAEVTNYTAGGIQINGGAGTTNLVHFTDTGSNKMWVGMTKGGVFLNVAGSDDMAIRNSVGDIHFGDGTSRMTLDTSSGNLGIGTLTPSQKLDVVGNINVNDFYIDNVKHIELGGVAGTTQPFIRFFTTANAFNAVVGTNQGVSYGLGDGLNDLAIRNDLGKIFFGANGAGNNMVFNPSSGGLGIGTATPTNKLEVIGNTDSTTYSVNGTAGANFSGVVTSITVVDGIVTAVS
jgi:hypothetical protein